jgi:hypothetical protein
MNRLASLRLTERCADTLISVREEIIDAGYAVAEELHAPIAKLNECGHTLIPHITFSLVTIGHLQKFSIFSQRWAIALSSSVT